MFWVTKDGFLWALGLSPKGLFWKQETTLWPMLFPCWRRPARDDSSQTHTEPQKELRVREAHGWGGLLEASIEDGIIIMANVCNCWCWTGSFFGGALCLD